MRSRCVVLAPLWGTVVKCAALEWCSERAAECVLKRATAATDAECDEALGAQARWGFDVLLLQLLLQFPCGLVPLHARVTPRSLKSKFLPAKPRRRVGCPPLCARARLREILAEEGVGGGWGSLCYLCSLIV